MVELSIPASLEKIKQIYRKLDTFGGKVIPFACSSSRGAYDRDTLHISSFESHETIPGPCARGVDKINIPSKKTMAYCKDRKTKLRISYGSI
jgi:hypothetical protein